MPQTGTPTPGNTTLQWKEWTGDTHHNLDVSHGNYTKLKKNQQATYYMVPFTEHSRNNKIIEMEKKNSGYPMSETGRREMPLAMKQ